MTAIKNIRRETKKVIFQKVTPKMVMNILCSRKYFSNQRKLYKIELLIIKFQNRYWAPNSENYYQIKIVQL